MGCPDKDNDARILRELERRKGSKKMVNTNIAWSGDLLDIQNLVDDLSKVSRIEKVGEYSYFAVLEK